MFNIAHPRANIGALFRFSLYSRDQPIPPPNLQDSTVGKLPCLLDGIGVVHASHRG